MRRKRAFSRRDFLKLGGAGLAGAYVIAYLEAPEAVSVLVQNIAGTNGTLIMVLIVVALVIAGDFLDAIPTIVISLPVITVLVELGGIDPVHMGVVAIVTLAFGLITPPTASLCSSPLLSRRCRSQGPWSSRCRSTWCSSWSSRCSSSSQPSRCGFPG
jgi:hypothetical protein